MSPRAPLAPVHLSLVREDVGPRSLEDVGPRSLGPVDPRSLGPEARGGLEPAASGEVASLADLRARISTAFHARGLPGLVGSGLEHRAVLPTGDERLDALLPGGGFPRGALSVLQGGEGVGRCAILAQVLAEETRAGRPVAWVDASETLYPPALEAAGVRLERLLIVRTSDPVKAARALEQIAASGLFRAIGASGLEVALTPVRARKLESAARGSGSAVLLVLDAGRDVSNAALTVEVSRLGRDPMLEVRRRRGPQPARRPAQARPALSVAG